MEHLPPSLYDDKSRMKPTGSENYFKRVEILNKIDFRDSSFLLKHKLLIFFEETGIHKLICVLYLYYYSTNQWVKQIEIVDL